MKELTRYQEKFLLDFFFKKEEYTGWKSIAVQLLKDGECLVAGDKCIWNGGIGNFIKTEEYPKAIGCLLYKFDLEYFLDSAWYEEIRNSYHSDLSIKKREIEQEYEDIANI